MNGARQSQVSTPHSLSYPDPISCRQLRSNRCSIYTDGWPGSPARGPFNPAVTAQWSGSTEPGCWQQPLRQKKRRARFWAGMRPLAAFKGSTPRPIWMHLQTHTMSLGTEERVQPHVILCILGMMSYPALFCTPGWQGSAGNGNHVDSPILQL